MIIMAITKPFISRLIYSEKPTITLTKKQKLAISKYLNGFNKAYFYEKLPCICGANNDILIAEKDRYGIPVTTVLCSNCGLMRSDPYLSQDSIIKFYKENYRNIYNAENGVETLFNNQLLSGKEILLWLRKKINYAPAVVFEIGCGAGGNLQAFKDVGCKVLGCDYDEEYLDFGRSKGINLKSGSIEKLQDHGKADLIILRHVIEHFLDPINELNKIKDILQPEGILYIEVPGIFSIRNNYQSIDKFLQNAHVWHFCLETLILLASKANYKLLYGDEVIRAAFIQNRGGQTSNINPHIYINILDSLKKTEKLRYVPVISVKKIFASSLKHLLGEFLFSKYRGNIKKFLYYSKSKF